VRHIEQLGRANGREALQREAPPLLFLSGRPLGVLEALERGDPVLQQPRGLTAPNTEPLDRFAVERQ